MSDAVHQALTDDARLSSTQANESRAGAQAGEERSPVEASPSGAEQPATVIEAADRPVTARIKIGSQREDASEESPANPRSHAAPSGDSQGKTRPAPDKPQTGRL